MRKPMPDFLNPPKPDYMTWDKKKLQQEYFKIRAELAGLKVRNIPAERRLEKTYRLKEALTEFMEGDELW